MLVTVNIGQSRNLNHSRSRAACKYHYYFKNVPVSVYALVVVVVAAVAVVVVYVDIAVVALLVDSKTQFQPLSSHYYSYAALDPTSLLYLLCYPSMKNMVSPEICCKIFHNFLITQSSNSAMLNVNGIQYKLKTDPFKIVRTKSNFTV